MYFYINLLHLKNKIFSLKNLFILWTTNESLERRKLFDLRLLAYMEYLFIINDIFN